MHGRSDLAGPGQERHRPVARFEFADPGQRILDDDRRLFPDRERVPELGVEIVVAVDHDDHEATTAALKRVREKVARTAKARNINYPVLLDEHNEVGGRYNGGELPTTVIVDAQGNVRRRFIGARNLAVFEAMIAEAGQDEQRAQTASAATASQ